MLRILFWTVLLLNPIVLAFIDVALARQGPRWKDWAASALAAGLASFVIALPLSIATALFICRGTCA
jgi:TRAP-type mannitol/chloroaromatic compound transport system permease small subunit